MTLACERLAPGWPASITVVGLPASRAIAGELDHIRSIDLLRGLAMMAMALEHVRDVFAAGGLNPRDVADPALLLTRWIAHYSGPTFAFRAGISALLYGAQRRSTCGVIRRLLARGLAPLAFAAVRLACMVPRDSLHIVAQVMFGSLMTAPAALVHRRRRRIAFPPFAVIAQHHLLRSTAVAISHGNPATNKKPPCGARGLSPINRPASGGYSAAWCRHLPS
jgi:uncharacterized membrane protein